MLFGLVGFVLGMRYEESKWGEVDDGDDADGEVLFPGRTYNANAAYIRVTLWKTKKSRLVKDAESFLEGRSTADVGFGSDNDLLVACGITVKTLRRIQQRRLTWNQSSSSGLS